IRAAEALKRVLCEAAARRLAVAREAIVCEGETYGVAAGERSLGFAETVAAALEGNGTVTVKGTWSTPPETQGGTFKGAAVGSSAGLSDSGPGGDVRGGEEKGGGEVEA